MATEEEKTDQITVSDEELFEGKPEPVVDESKAEEPEEKDEKVPDDKGRFTAKSEEETSDEKPADMQRSMEGNFSLGLARSAHKEVFEEAWTEMMTRWQNGDDTMRQQVLQSVDPGETLVGLYKREKVSKEVGDDPAAWLEKKQQEWLDDPEVQAKLLEKARATASTQPTQKVKLPPSLNKATGSGSDPGSNDMGDAALWKDTL